MKSQPSNIQAGMIFLAVVVLSFSSLIWAQNRPEQDSSSKPKQKQELQRTFATPELAAEALINAAEAYDVPALQQLFGPEGEDLIASADPVHDRSIAQEFAEKARRKHSLAVSKTHATLLVGEEEWPLPIPIVKKQTKWSFDTKAGRDQILLRRIGANELDAIQICRGYVEAQKEYAATTHDGAKATQYAQKIISTPGKQDGLVWKNQDGALEGPISQGIARALEEGYSDKAEPFHGYYFKVLKGQGPHAAGGALPYVIDGIMIGGFALVAAPAEYRVTGVKTFLVSHEGVVYEKDLGPDSLKFAKEMVEYDPDKTWHRTNVELASQQ
jgi:hypothetical protein